MNTSALLIFAAVVHCGGVRALVGERAWVEPVGGAVLSGRPASLHCRFDLQGDTLYSVKWYRGRQEFYRYTLKDSPPVKTFPVPGLRELRVQVGGSNASLVSLAAAWPSLAGRYSCEVSADAPSFQTALLTTDALTVVVAPAERPRVEWGRKRGGFAVGDTLRARCSSARSRPAANLTWALNGVQVDGGYVKVYDVVYEEQDNLETSSSTIEKVLTAKDFNSKGRLKIRCTASILSAYWQTTERSARLLRPTDTHTHTHTHSPPTAGRADEEEQSVPAEVGGCPPRCPPLPLLVVVAWLLLN